MCYHTQVSTYFSTCAIFWVVCAFSEGGATDQQKVGQERKRLEVLFSLLLFALSLSQFVH